jgi:hypothetical protein
VRAVIYARISEDHERAESLPTQIANGTRYAERMGWEVVRVFKDEGRSGYTGPLRPGFEEMIKFLGGGQTDVLPGAATTGQGISGHPGAQACGRGAPLYVRGVPSTTINETGCQLSSRPCAVSRSISTVGSAQSRDGLSQSHYLCPGHLVCDGPIRRCPAGGRWISPRNCL